MNSLDSLGRIMDSMNKESEYSQKFSSSILKPSENDSLFNAMMQQQNVPIALVPLSDIRSAVDPSIDVDILKYVHLQAFASLPLPVEEMSCLDKIWEAVKSCFAAVGSFFNTIFCCGCFTKEVELQTTQELPVLGNVEVNRS